MLTQAVRGGLLYQEIGNREAAVLTPSMLTPGIVDMIRRFRAAQYGDIPAVYNGVHYSLYDSDGHHVLLIESGRLLGCARYNRPIQRGPSVHLGGFAVSRRGTTAAITIVYKLRELASYFGDKRFLAVASVPFGSASILKKLGGTVLRSYFDPLYQRETEVIELVLS